MRYKDFTKTKWKFQKASDVKEEVQEYTIGSIMSNIELDIGIFFYNNVPYLIGEDDES